MILVYLFHFFLFCNFLRLLSAGDGGVFPNPMCPCYFECGNLGRIYFPFTTPQRPDCGVLAIHGCDDRSPNASKSVQLKKEGKPLVVKSMDWSPIIFMVHDEDLGKFLKSGSCDAFSYNVTLPASSPLGYFQIKHNISVFKCRSYSKVNPPRHLLNYTCSSHDIYFFVPPDTEQSLTSLAQCSILQLPTNALTISTDPFTFLTADISIEFQSSEDCKQCLDREGRCQLDSKRMFYCNKDVACSQPQHDRGGLCQFDSRGSFHCKKASEDGRKSLALKIGLGVVPALTILALVIVRLYYTKCKKQNPTHQMIEAFLERHGPLQSKRYSYSDVVKVTNSFRNKLGQGGYGNVYKGKLLDGRPVAVKVLSELKGNGEEFINEVASISRTSHVNIVTLLGFCCEGSKRALVYEFMPNGSLEKFIYEGKAQGVNPQLNCQTLYNIAIGVGRGLEYLHRGCNARILHFDIKPHNILLDKDFCPKISDFGLAKICPRKESIVSLSGLRGTVGYIAPEVFSRNFGEVSHKSDVYSYGMMILEMIGGRKNINTEVDHSSEIYFPSWIYNCLDANQELRLMCIKDESDDEKVRKMSIVSLWCIQTNPSTRPTMSKALKMLEESLELLQMPPKPFLFSSSSTNDCATQTLESL